MTPDTHSVALIVIFNHKYDKNIETIEALYKHRFQNIYHLVPFYDGEKENVIPVYENSFFFQGYIAQGLKYFYKDQYSHYIFIADDMILNPVINEANFREQLNLNPGTSFIPRMGSMPETERFWPHNRDAITFNPYKLGVEVRKEIPSPEDAEKILAGLNITNRGYSYSQVYGKISLRSFKDVKKSFFNFCNYFTDRYIHGASLKKTRYPLVRSYSDICIVSRDSIKKFCHYCGVFASTDLFVELAIPLSLALSSEDIRTEKDLKLKGRALWTKEDYVLLDRFSNNLSALLSNFPEDYLYLHPVKLSMWK